MKLSLLTLILTFMCSSVQAADVNITADEKVEWHQKEQKIVAIGNAIATKDDMSIHADRLSGYYADRTKTPKGKSSITKVEARGNVKLRSSNADAFGHSMDYDLVQDVAILKGTPAKIKTDNETITAEDNITYYPAQQKAVAFGNVTAVDKDQNKLYSDKMVAFFKNGAKGGSLTLDKVEIYDNVKIVTKDTNVTAKRGVYYPELGKVKLFEDIVINQDGNILRGDQAETDLKSGVSKLISTKKSGRVKGVFKEKNNSVAPKK